MICVRQIVNEVFASNTYLLSNGTSNDYWLVDIGDFNKVTDILPKDANIKGVFLTHSHFDHMYGLNDVYKHYPNAVIYTSEYGKEAIYSAKKNFSYYHDSPIAYLGDIVKVLYENSEIELWKDICMKTIYTPGHCPSCLTYILGKYIFTGDSYIPNIPVVSKLPKGNKILAEESRNRILRLSKGMVICPGHGDVLKSIIR